MATCPGCGQTGIDGDVCSRSCAETATAEAKWRGKEPCQKCMEESDENDWEPATHGDLCSHHEEQRNEAAYDRLVEDFYG